MPRDFPAQGFLPRVGPLAFLLPAHGRLGAPCHGVFPRSADSGLQRARAPRTPPFTQGPALGDHRSSGHGYVPPARAVLPPGHLQRVPAPRETAFASCCGAASFSLGGACARWSLQRATVLSRARCFLLYATAALHRAQLPVVPRCLVTPVQPKVRHGRPRSKSPCRARARSGTGREAADGIVALPSLRPGAPERLPRRRGQLPDLSTDHLRTRTLSELVSNVYAASSRPALLSRLRTAQHILASWGDQLLPPTAPKVMQLCAGLRSGGYRSAEA